MYYAAHDTLTLDSVGYILQEGNGFFKDTAVMQLMDLDFYYLTANALTTGTYFIFDTINDRLFDNPSRPAFPFDSSNIFAACASSLTFNHTNVVFRIDPQFIYTDQHNQLYYANGLSLKIDFGDGNGYQAVDPSIVSHYPVLYGSAGNKIIKVAVFNNKNEKIKESISKIAIAGDVPSIPPDEVLDLPGLEVGVYHACSEGNKRAIIYLEGFDMLDFLPGKSRGVKDLYTDMIQASNTKLSELENFGYDYYVVNWKNSRIDMRFNALYVLNLIEYIKLNQEGNEQIVIIGESMGGVIARYTLTYMESDEYLNGDYSPFFVEETDPSNALYLALHPEIFDAGDMNRDPEKVEQLHNTRLLITLDSPHQGANVPLSLQYFYRSVQRTLFGYESTLMFSMMNQFLYGKAAKQLLIYHIDTRNTANVPYYTSDDSRFDFLDQLYDMGDYPRYCKLMALSSGSLYGRGLENAFTSNDRTPGDKLLEFEGAYYARILFIRIPFLSAWLNLYTNSNSSEYFIDSGIGITFFKLKLKWFKIALNVISTSQFDDDQYYTGVTPFCVNAGGYIGKKEGLFVDGTFNLSNLHLFNWFGYDLGMNGSCIDFSAHTGINGLASSNVELSACTDGFAFTFVPIQSALAYGNFNHPLDHNIETEGISTKLGKTPFDVIMGYPGNTNLANNGHLYFRDEPIYNLTQQDAVNSGGLDNYKYAYHSCASLYELDVQRSLLCLEIGDEELYLENLTLNRDADFRAEYDIHVNDRNPYYVYPSQPGPLVMSYTGIYSKEDPLLQPDPNAHINFTFDWTNSPSGTPGLTFGALFDADFLDVDEPLVICCVKFSKSLTFGPQASLPVKETEAFMHMYPNPTDGRELHLRFAFADDSDEAARMTVCDLSGRVVLRAVLQQDGAGPQEALLDLGADAGPGIYFVYLQKGGNTLTDKLVIN